MLSKPTDQTATAKPIESLAFDHHALRAFVGVIAFCFPFVVTVLAGGITSSISASYHTGARDVFVGALFTIGILLIGYKGHRPVLEPGYVGSFWQVVGGIANRVASLWHERTDYRVIWRRDEEDLVSTIGGGAAIVTALAPTACDACEVGTLSWIHYLAAATLFLTVVYFCLTAFLRRVSEKLHLRTGLRPFLRALWGADAPLTHKLWKENARKVVRGCIYACCGLLISIILLLALLAQVFLPSHVRVAWHTTFIAEAGALFFFGIAWTTACERLWFLRDKDDQLREAAPAAPTPVRPTI